MHFVDCLNSVLSKYFWLAVTNYISTEISQKLMLPLVLMALLVTKIPALSTCRPVGVDIALQYVVQHNDRLLAKS